jgi:hypothetical protein
MPEICGFIGTDGQAKPMRIDNLSFAPARVRDKPAFDPNLTHRINFILQGEPFLMRVRGVPGREALRHARHTEASVLVGENKNSRVNGKKKPRRRAV